ncbi:MAG TPA: NDP-sugar synthase [Thermoanaerobaculia bacterium]
MTAIRAGGIIAAGEGSRLRSLKLPKPMIPVGGKPLVAHVLENFAASGIESASVIFNGDEQDCADFVRSRFGDLAKTVIVQTTASSFESFQIILARSRSGRLLVSTVDAYCPREDFLSFVHSAEKRSEEETVLAVTTYVADEKPLWVKRGSDGRISEIGGPTGDAITAGIYVIPPRVRSLPIPRRFDRLRDYLAWLCSDGHPVSGILIPRVVDVDRPEDLPIAEQLSAASSLAKAQR